jgi:hypothetical protein
LTRAAEFSVPLSALLGRSLWRYATPEIVAQELLLDDCGWRSVLAPAPLEFGSGVNHSPHVPIHESRWRAASPEARTQRRCSRHFAR